MPDAPYLWLGRPGQETLQRGVARELAEQSADASHANVIAPPCPACGQPVADKDWEAHKYSAHGISEMCQPWGRPDAREAMFVHVTAARLGEKIAAWRSRHPGVQLQLSGDGFDRARKLFWRRYRIFDAAGKPAQ